MSGRTVCASARILFHSPISPAVDLLQTGRLNVEKHAHGFSRPNTASGGTRGGAGEVGDGTRREIEKKQYASPARPGPAAPREISLCLHTL